LRIAIDATPLTCATGGIRRYVVELTRALALGFPGDELILLSDQEGWQLPDELRDIPNVQAPPPYQHPLLGKWLRRKWWSAGLPAALRRHRADVFHGTDFSVPYLPLRPSVLTVHDLSPWKEPPLRAIGAGRIRSRTPFLLRLATLVVTPTLAVKQELVERFAVAPSRVAVTALAAREGGQPPRETDVTDWLLHKGIQQPYLVALADPQPRKNIDRLIEAWRAARAACPDLRLVCVGDVHGDTMERYGQDGLRILPFLADSELQFLLSGAVAFVYPSLYEGFGLPVLEAMQLGVPVITSQDAAIGEVAGAAALLVDATNTKLLTESLVEVSTSSGL
jgi:glycosyltransferase involved in cell wall biosynthesis